MCAKHYENPTMHSRVTAKNVGDVFFETHCIYIYIYISILNHIFNLFIKDTDSVPYCENNGNLPLANGNINTKTSVLTFHTANQSSCHLLAAFL